MIQRALATLLCLLGAAAIGLGVASATLWRADDVLVARAQAATGTTMIVTEPGVLDMAADEVTVTARSDSGRVVIAMGRTRDVDAWVGGDAHTRVSGLADWHLLATAAEEAAPTPSPTPSPSAAETEPPAAGEGDAPAEEAADGAAEDAEADEEPAAAPDPTGSDLWLDEVSGRGEVTFDWSASDGRWSVLVAATGSSPAPPEIALAWPQEVTTPWLWPGVAVGAVLLLAGLAWWVLILVAGRRPVRAAASPRAEPAAEPAAVPAGALTRRQLRELEARGPQRPRQKRRELHERFPVLVPAPLAGRAEPADDAAAAATRRLRPRRRSRASDAVPDAVEHRPIEAPEPVAPAGPPPGTPAASADAWRRAWGLPASTPPPGGPDAPPAAPAPTPPTAVPPDQPRRRRDNR